MSAPIARNSGRLLKTIAPQMLTRSRLASLTSNLNLKHDSNGNCFYYELEGLKAFVEYSRKGDIITLEETFVPQEFEGRGIGKLLAKDVFDQITKDNLKIKIKCDFLAHYLEKYGDKYKNFCVEN